MILTQQATVTRENPTATIIVRNNSFTGRLTNIVIGPDLIEISVPLVVIGNMCAHQTFPEEIHPNAWALKYMNLDYELLVGSEFKVSVDATQVFNGSSGITDLTITVYANLVEKSRASTFRKKRYLVCDEID